MQYICEKCGEISEEDELDEIEGGSWEVFWGERVWMSDNRSVCPYCGSDEIRRYYEDDEDDEEEEEEEEDPKKIIIGGTKNEVLC